MFSPIAPVFLLNFALVSTEIIITYPGWRGNNLFVNESFPYGMQWMYPCKLHLLYAGTLPCLSRIFIVSLPEVNI